MKTKKRLLILTGLLFVVTVLSIWTINHIDPPLVNKTIQSDVFGAIERTQPAWGNPKGSILAFVDSKQISTVELSQKLAAKGVIAEVIDAGRFINSFDSGTEHCLEAKQVSKSLETLLKDLPVPNGKPPIIAGIAEGALIPFLNAQVLTEQRLSNLSIGFSVALPDKLVLCPPLSTQYQQNQQSLVSSPKLNSNWRSVWADQPEAKTGVFIKALGEVDVRIAAYDTPLETLLIDELNTSMGLTNTEVPPMPVVEMKTSQPSHNVTLFYSGDGGWRDLDRTVADEMVKLNYPVVGVDVLRYFWEHKTPEQAAADLSATMAYYRKHWQVGTFVLTGYSFGADILPALYNRLPQNDKDSVALLVLLALAESADFEIHVSGWLGHSSGELPLAPELAKIAKSKLLCVYGRDEKAETACNNLLNTEANIVELPGGHHFDQDYPKLTRQILDVYQQHHIN
ncbi:MAG: AcvB/VirJ family lysyl-phosphatidylglycerol hydrolase [Methylococcales bacterium]